MSGLFLLTLLVLDVQVCISTSLVAIHHVCSVTHLMQNITPLFSQGLRVMLFKAFAFYCVNLGSMKEII
uniref:Putative ovule protein n=1 Tax=Solanum chacoense TaxID=4108 RepID=A0A0V0H529_SOLCH